MVIMSNMLHDVLVRPFFFRARTFLQLCLHVFLDVVCLNGTFKLAVFCLKAHVTSPQTRENLALS